MTPTTHYLTRVPNETFHDEPGYFSAAETLRMGYRTYAVGGWDETAKGRAVQEGPLVRGPHVYTFQHAAVIALHPLPETRKFVDVQFGDLVRVDGLVYELLPAPNQNVKLEPVDPAELTARRLGGAASAVAQRGAPAPFGTTTIYATAELAELGGEVKWREAVQELADKALDELDLVMPAGATSFAVEGARNALSSLVSKMRSELYGRRLAYQAATDAGS